MDWQVTLFAGDLNATMIQVRDYLQKDLSVWAARRAKVTSDGNQTVVFYRAEKAIVPSNAD